MASKQLKRAIKVTCIVVLPIFVLWFVIFQWRFIPYPKADFICHSPNHEYYIKRYQTPFESLQQQDYGEGVAILYDKSGKELYRGHTFLSGGPYWLRNSDGESSVFFQGGDDEWGVDTINLLPFERPERRRYCYDEPVGTVASQ